MIKDMVNHPADITARCEEAYAKAQELQDKLNAVITFVDPKDQLAQLPEGGLLHGVPIAIKDNVNTKGIRTTAGSRILSNYFPIYDATIAVLQVPLKEASRFGIMNCDKNDMIQEFEEKPAHPKSNLASMGIYIFTYKTLRKYLLEDDKNENSSHDFGKDIIPAYLDDNKVLAAYRFKGYWKDVGTIDSLWESNMDLLNNDNTLNLGDPDWKIYTEDINALPQFIGENAVVHNSYITQGTVVLGQVKNSVLGTNSFIDEGANIQDSVILTGAKIGAGAKITRCIVADNVEIGPGVVLGSADSDHIELIAKDVME